MNNLNKWSKQVKLTTLNTFLSEINQTDTKNCNWCLKDVLYVRSDNHQNSELMVLCFFCVVNENQKFAETIGIDHTKYHSRNFFPEINLEDTSNCYWCLIGMLCFSRDHHQNSELIGLCFFCMMNDNEKLAERTEADHTEHHSRTFLPETNQTDTTICHWFL